ncbi:MAG TPA: HAMP domain-containing sensor histidine kinase [Actinomycetota bacterium]|nr:HAMP domain-containing sensor histidine kinase [Actinomycetota bacterium]
MRAQGHDHDPGAGARLAADQALALVRSVTTARSHRTAVRALLRLFAQAHGLPLGAWTRSGGGAFSLVDVVGLGRRGTARVRRDLHTVVDPRESEWARLLLLRGFAAAAGWSKAELAARGDVLVVAALPGSYRLSREELAQMASVVNETLARLDLMRRRERRKQDLDLALALMAHEVRAPLAAVRAALDRLLVAEPEPAARRDLLQRSRRELGELAELADTLLRWASGLGSLRRRRVSLGRVAVEAVRSSLNGEGKDRVRVDVPPGLLITADRRHLRTALANVVRNALTYSPCGGEIRVTAGPAGDVVRLRVEDQGPGVPPEEREAIFEPFVRGGTAQGTVGSGLGLFLARRIIEAHRGSIRVDGDGPGTVFEIELPRVSVDGRRRVDHGVA